MAFTTTLCCPKFVFVFWSPKPTKKFTSCVELFEWIIYSIHSNVRSFIIDGIHFKSFMLTLNIWKENKPLLELTKFSSKHLMMLIYTVVFPLIIIFFFWYWRWHISRSLLIFWRHTESWLHNLQLKMRTYSEEKLLDSNDSHVPQNYL